MLGLSPWWALLVVLIAALLARQLPSTEHASPGWGLVRRLAQSVRQCTEHRMAPAVAGVLTGLATWYVWGSLSRSAVVHDESAYLFQAELFARLRWTAPTPAISAFFEQLYLNLSPAIFSKYPPGTSLLLAPGVLLGVPGLPIVVMNALTGAVAYALARRLSDGPSALLTWMMWITSFPVLYFHAMYLSEVPSSLAWLAAWWGLARWRTSGRFRDLFLCALSVALCGITRPLTAVALALAIGATLLAMLVRRSAPGANPFRRCILAFGIAGALVVALTALWSWRSTGNVRDTPLALYTRTYVPFDGLGFGARQEDAPTARLPWDQRVTSNSFYLEHRAHTVSALPRNALKRTRVFAHDMWYDWRGGLAVVAIVGAIGAPVAAWIGLAAVIVHLLFYLLYAHPATWSLYYIELLPVLAFFTALGVRRLCTNSANGTPKMHGLAFAAGMLLIATLYPAGRTLKLVRTQITGDHGYYDAFVRLIPRTAAGAIVFVRYAPTHHDGLSLVRNVIDLESAHAWIVYDRGDENDRLRLLAPQRAALLFDEATWTMRPMAPLAVRRR